MIEHVNISPQELHGMIRRKEIFFGGNRKLKIYGKLGCGSGKRMKRENRVFFNDEEEALEAGYRPCGNCMRQRISSQ